MLSKNDASTKCVRPKFLHKAERSGAARCARNQMAFVRELNLDKAHILPDINVVGEFYGRRCHAARFFQTFFMLLLTTKKFAVK